MDLNANCVALAENSGNQYYKISTYLVRRLVVVG